MSGDELVIIMGCRPSAPYQGASPWAGLLNSPPPLYLLIYFASSLKGQFSPESQLSVQHFPNPRSRLVAPPTRRHLLLHPSDGVEATPGPSTPGFSK